MEDYSKVAVVKEKLRRPLGEVRGAIRPASLLWREACAPAPRLREELAPPLAKLLEKLQQTQDWS